MGSDAGTVTQRRPLQQSSVLFICIDFGCWVETKASCLLSAPIPIELQPHLQPEEVSMEREPAALSPPLQKCGLSPTQCFLEVLLEVM